MIPSLDEHAQSLLKHLGVHLFPVLHSHKDGSTSEQLHVFTPRTHMNHVLGWVARNQLGPYVRVFEGPPPPF